MCLSACSPTTTAIGTKADGSALTTAEGTISTHSGEIVGLQTSVATKANAADVVTLSLTVVGHTSTIATKAVRSALTAAEGTIVTHRDTSRSLPNRTTTLGLRSTIERS